MHDLDTTSPAAVLRWFAAHGWSTPETPASRGPTLLSASPVAELWLEPEPMPGAAARARVRSLARRCPSGVASLVCCGAPALVAVSIDAGATATSAPLDHAEVVAPATTLRDPLIFGVALERAIARRNVERTFFDDIRNRVRAIAPAWRSGTPLSNDARNALTLRLVSRLMFLAFVARKGWLADDPHFITRLAHDQPLDLFRATLRPLFFEALNQRAPTDPRFAGVPFLNGGLFEQTRWELAHADVDLADTEAHALVALMGRYRFHAAERAQEAAVDPRMLGTVFERLMLRSDRARTGAHYTPPALVDSVVTDALAPLAGALDGARVLDPAVGSGAFLLGALHALLDHHRARRPDVDDATLVRSILAHQLYGVDVSDAAVTLCRLRLWLALAAHLPDGTGPHVVPLPNLSHRIRQGNALLSHTSFAASQGIALPPTLAVEHRRLAAALVTATDADKATLDAELRKTERALGVALAEGRVERAQRALDEHEQPAQTSLLPQASVADRQTSRRLGRALDDARAALERVRSNEAVGFDPHVHFADAMDAGGFDAVLGNPPWVRMADQPPEVRTALRATSRWVSAAGSGAPFGAQPDLSVAFVERALSLTRPGGTIGLLVPAKLMTANYADALRAGLLRDTRLVHLRMVPHGAHGFDAAVYPMALIASRMPACQKVRVTAGSSFELPTELLPAWSQSGAPWPLIPPPQARLLRHLLSAAPPLRERLVPRMGVKTGCNAAFVDPPELPHVVPALRGGDVGELSATPSTRLLFAHDVYAGAPLPGVDEPVRVHLAAFSMALRARADASPDDQPWTLFRVRDEALGWRVAVRDISPRLMACALAPVCDGGPVALNTVFTLAVAGPAAAARLAGWLSSAPCRFVAAAVAEPAMGGYRRFRARTIGQLPLPAAVVTGDGPLGRALTEAALRLTADPASRSARAELDAIACRMLGMTQAEERALRGERCDP